MIKIRSNHQRCSVRKSVLRNLAKFKEKHQCHSLFFNKVVDLMPEACNFIKKETLAQVFSCEFCEISKSTFFTEHLWTTVFRESSTVVLAVNKTKRFSLVNQTQKQFIIAIIIIIIIIIIICNLLFVESWYFDRKTRLFNLIFEKPGFSF